MPEPRTLDNPMPERNASRAGRIRRIVIVGRDEALWMTANIMRLSFHRTGLEIVAVELPSLLNRVDVTPSLRNQQAFHHMLGIPEGPLLDITQGAYSLGQRFINFSKTIPSFMHGYGTYGATLKRVLFHQYWVKARTNGLPLAFDDFSLNAVAARQGRFFKPAEETDAFSACDYAYHFEAIAYAEVLKELMLGRGGVTHIRAELDDVQIDPESGDITAVRLSDGQTVDGDFFIDASGADSLLLGKALGTEFESWREWFPCDRLLTTAGPSMSPIPAFSQIAAFPAGWVGVYPLRGRTAIQQAYSSQYMKDEDALQNASSVLSMKLVHESYARITPWAPGRRRSAWIANCVGIGQAAAVFDPIDGVGLHSILTGLSHLSSMLPLDRDMALERKEYNLNVSSSYDRIRDYQICHYKLNQRHDQPFWDQCRDMTLPDRLAYKIEQFAARGHLVEYDDETFVDYDWNSMFIGHGLVPRAYDPGVDETPDGEIIAHFEAILSFIKTHAEAMQPMDAFFTPAAAAAAR